MEDFEKLILVLLLLLLFVLSFAYVERVWFQYKRDLILSRLVKMMGFEDLAEKGMEIKLEPHDLHSEEGQRYMMDNMPDARVRRMIAESRTKKRKKRGET